MTEQSIAKKGIILNTVLVIATLVAFLVIRITNQYLLSSYGYSGYYMEIYTVQRATFIGLLVVSIAIIIFSIILMTKSRSKNTGFILLIIGAALAAILAMRGLMLGIVTWILCGVSINQFRKLQGESNFESNLDFGAIAELKKTVSNDTQTQASPVSETPVHNVVTVVEAEAVPAEAESAPVDVAYEVKADDATTPPENNEA